MSHRFLKQGSQAWVLFYRGREWKLMPVEEIVRRLTSDTAQVFGLPDRGVIAPRMKADSRKAMNRA